MSHLGQVPVRCEVLVPIRDHRGVAVHVLQHRLAHDVADQLLDGARQVIVVDQGEELLEVDVPGNEVTRCLGSTFPGA